MRARIFFSPYLILLFTLLILVLLEWMNVAPPSRPRPLQDEPRQVPFSQQNVPLENPALAVNGKLNQPVYILSGLSTRDFLLAGQTYLPLTIYPLRLLLSGSG